MGKYVDRLVFLTACTAAIYILFMQAFKNIPSACCMTLLCGYLIRKAAGKRFRGRNLTAMQAEHILFNWAFGPDSEAEEEIRRLLSPDEMTALVYLPRHPSAVISTGDVFTAWKSHRGERKIIIATACNADGRVRSFASTLASPEIEIMDAAKLLTKIRRSDLKPSPAHLPNAFSGIRTLFSDRRFLNRTSLYGIGLFCVYWITANPLYLIISMGMLLLAGISLRSRFL